VAAKTKVADEPNIGGKERRPEKKKVLKKWGLKPQQQNSTNE
jgi:hypothetical protein